MTLEEMRDACAKAAANEAEHAEGADGIDTANRAADAIRAIPLPAPVDDELARVTKERDEAQAGCSALLGELHGLAWEWRALGGGRQLCFNNTAPPGGCRCSGWHVGVEFATLTRERDEARAARDAATVVAINDGQALLTLRTEVAGLTTALAAAQRERDEAQRVVRAHQVMDDLLERGV